MDMHEIIVNNVIQKMTNILEENQLEQLRFVLDLELSQVDIEKPTTELALPINNQELLKQYIGSMLVEGKQESTIKRYKYIIDKFECYIDKDFTKVTTQDIKYFLAIYKTQRHCSNTTVDGMRLCLNAFFSWLEREEYIYRNPLRKIGRIKKDTQKERELYGYEIELLRQNCNNLRNRALFEFIYSTGCRVSEVCKAEINDINFEKKSCLVHGKGNKDRIVYFNDECMVYLREYLNTRNDNVNYLFKSLRGDKGLSVDGVERIFTDLGQKANVKNVHPHRFRVTRITNLINKGMAMQNVQRLVGHSDISTTERYFRTNLADVQHEYFKYCS